MRVRDLGAVRGAVRSVGARVVARQSAARGAVFGAVRSTARGAGICTELAATIPELIFGNCALVRCGYRVRRAAPVHVPN